MTRILVNLAPHLVAGEIETVLDDYPYHPHQQAFAIPEVRQELAAYVLDRLPRSYVPNSYDVHEGDKATGTNCMVRMMDMETLIHAGIQDILRSRWEWISQHIPEPADAGLQASHWFG